MNSFILLFVVFGAALAQLDWKCSDCSAPVLAVAGKCPAGKKLVNKSYCCKGKLECPNDVAIGPCINNGCSFSLGYACDYKLENCCPTFDYKNPANILGAPTGGICPSGYAVLYSNEHPNGICVAV